MLLLLWACSAAPRPAPVPARATFDAMATRVEVVVPDAGRLEEAVALTRAACERVEIAANEWRDDSPLAAVNRAAGDGEAIPVPPDLGALLTRSVELSRTTRGAFDPTWAALWHTWSDLGTPPRVPDAATIEAQRALVGVEGLVVGAGTARLTRAGMAVGLGAIAKGWALDRAADALGEAGVADFSLSAGGQVRAEGHPAPDQPWRVGLRVPRPGATETFGAVTLESGSVSTSGDYERYVEIDGVRYGHVLDPRTGWPATGARSATVIAGDGTTADAWSTALLVLPVAEGIALATSTPGIDAIVVDRDGRVHLTPGALARVEALDEAALR